jgi:pyruvate formate lyase activating enzyme
MHEALLYKKLKNNSVQCELCNHFCIIEKGQLGVCASRINVDGRLDSLVGGRSVSTTTDPIEKKPLFHFLPGSLTYSLGTYGCNFTCLNCHNWTLSQAENIQEKVEKIEEVPPEKIVFDAIQSGCRSISYTYNEPTQSVEYYLEIMKIARNNKLKNIWVTNGFMSEKCLSLIMPYLDAVNVDLKSFDGYFYKEHCGGRLEPVLKNIEILYNEQVHLEVTTLLIPGLTTSSEMLIDLSNYIASLDIDIPWHITKFSALISHKLTKNKDTDEKDVHSAYEIGKQAGLNFIYVGNMPGDQKENTYCHNCGELCIRRFAYRIERFDVKKACPNCSQLLGIT